MFACVHFGGSRDEIRLPYHPPRRLSRRRAPHRSEAHPRVPGAPPEPRSARYVPRWGAWIGLGESGQREGASVSPIDAAVGAGPQLPAEYVGRVAPVELALCRRCCAGILHALGVATPLFYCSRCGWSGSEVGYVYRLEAQTAGGPA
mgnify:CR=1 FL=1